MKPTDDDALQSQVLDDLLAWASGQQARETRAKLGKPVDEEEPLPDEPGAELEDAPEGDIPGMDPPESAGADGEPPLEGGEEELDEEALKAALAALGG